MSFKPVARAVAAGACAVLLGTSCAQLTHLPTLTKADLKFKPPQSSRIYASDGRLITTLHGEQNRTVIHSLKRIPKHVQNAVIAIEDQRFYEHGGVDLHAIFRALLTNAATGEVQQGGSTITQQYVKNAIIAPHSSAARTITRKIDEAALARQLEQKWSKHKILLAYLNTVYFGEGAYGVQAAAKTYFGKSAHKLTLSEGAALAAIIQNPEDFDPFKHPQANKARRTVVLNKMEELGWVTADHADEARAKKLDLRPAKEKDRYPAPYFVDYVQRLITYDPRFKVLGDTPEQRTKQLFQGGLRIYTTVDLADQSSAEAAVRSQLSDPTDPHASLVAIDPNTGYVKAMVGGRDWFATPKEDPFAKLNLAVLAEPGLGHVKPAGSKKYEDRAPGTGRQAGSSFKPFALIAAIKQGVSLSEQFKAAPCMDFPGADAGGDWHVCNYEGESFAHKISLLEATVHSVNVVYAQLILKIGAEAVVNVARDMGINTTLLAVPSAALGTNPVNPLDMASAYGTLATGGVHHPPVAVKKIVDEHGDVIYRDKSDPERVLDPAVSYIATSALEQVIARGTGVNAQIGRPEAGKTGTGQEYRDAWFVGYTPDLVAAVWMGYPQGEIEMKPSCIGSTSECIPTQTLTSGGVTGGSFPALIWKAFMLPALSDVPASSFQSPSIGIVTVTIDTRNGCLAGRFTPEEDRASATFARGTEPTETCREPGDRANGGKTVPDVFGFPAAEARRILEDEGFGVAETQQASSTYPPGRVIGQSPDGGAKAPAGSTVTIVVSTAGDDAHTVPDVLGQTRSSAEAELRSAGYAVRVITEEESNHGQAKKHSGRVWKQDPSGGSSASSGSTVTIWVNP